MIDSARDRLLRRGLKLSHLRLLSALQKTGQLSAAAAQIATSQPAASRLLSEAERVAGATLYRRHSRGIELTEAGRHFSMVARRVLTELDSASQEIEEMESGRRGYVSIGAVTGAALEHVLPVLRQTRMTHPRISVGVAVDTSDKLGPLLLAEQLDFYIGRIPGDIDRRAFIAEPIGPEPVALIVRQGHPLTRRQQPSLEECVEFDWVLQPLGGLMRQTVENYLIDRRIGLPARIISTSSTLMTLALISQSNAIAPIARAAATFFSGEEGLGAKVVRIPVAEDLVVTSYSLLRPSTRNLSPAAAIVHDQVRARFAAKAA